LHCLEPQGEGREQAPDYLGGQGRPGQLPHYHRRRLRNQQGKEEILKELLYDYCAFSAFIVLKNRTE
jgi:hypothetical protein